MLPTKLGFGWKFETIGLLMFKLYLLQESKYPKPYRRPQNRTVEHRALNEEKKHCLICSLNKIKLPHLKCPTYHPQKRAKDSVWIRNSNDSIEIAILIRVPCLLIKLIFFLFLTLPSIPIGSIFFFHLL